jgi:spermidine synthase
MRTTSASLRILGDGSAGRPFLREDERCTSLHFDLTAVQSRMRRSDPLALELEYTRAMMGFLLWQPAPRSMLMIGLGGGSLPKYCHRHLPAADITVVEIDADVISLREAFLVPADGERFRVLREDGAAFVARLAASGGRYDVIMVDGFDASGQPGSLCTPRFYANCRTLLQPEGLLVANLHNDAHCERWIQRISRSFMGRVMKMITRDRGNRIVFAGALRRGDFDSRWVALHEVHRRTIGKSAGRLKQAMMHDVGSLR